MEDSDGNLHHAWTVPTDLNPMSCINDTCYSDGHATLRLLQEGNSSTANMELVQNVIRENFSDWSRENATVAKTLRTRGPSEELLFTNGSSFIFAVAPHVART